MMLGLLFEPLFNKIITKLKINKEAWWYKLIQMTRTTLFVLIGMLIFRAHRLKDAFTMFISMFNMDNIGMLANNALYSIGIKPADFIVIAVGVLIMLIISIIQEKGVNIRESIAKKNIFFRWILYYGILLSILIFGIYGPGYVASNFIYGQF